MKLQFQWKDKSLSIRIPPLRKLISDDFLSEITFPRLSFAKGWCFCRISNIVNVDAKGDVIKGNYEHLQVNINLDGISSL